jgi:hypothetical protein
MLNACNIALLYTYKFWQNQILIRDRAGRIVFAHTTTVTKVVL